MEKQRTRRSELLRFALLVPLGAMVVSACAPQRPLERGASETMAIRSYRCSDGYAFTAHVTSNEAWVLGPVKTYRLHRVWSASGAKYSDGDVTYWSRAQEVRLESGGEVHSGCRLYRVKREWEEARSRGVDFRARGRQPPWELELTLRGRTVLITELGLARYEFRTPAPSVDREARRTDYRMRSSRHALDLVLEGRPCENVISGERFPTRVTATLDGTRYQGCGRALR